jgi:hypothetical protein
MIVSMEPCRYNIDLVAVQKITWEGNGTEPTGEHRFSYGKGNENHEFGTGFLVIKVS